jgi:hypothetical protein
MVLRNNDPFFPRVRIVVSAGTPKDEAGLNRDGAELKLVEMTEGET